MIIYSQLAKFKCGSCSHIFNEQEAKCENWRDPKKSLICPKCDNYLELKKNGNSHIFDTAALIIFIVCLLLSIFIINSKSLGIIVLFFYFITRIVIYGNPWEPRETDVIQQKKI